MSPIILSADEIDDFNSLINRINLLNVKIKSTCNDVATYLFKLSEDIPSFHEIFIPQELKLSDEIIINNFMNLLIKYYTNKSYVDFLHLIFNKSVVAKRNQFLKTEEYMSMISNITEINIEVKDIIGLITRLFLTISIKNKDKLINQDIYEIANADILRQKSIVKEFISRFIQETIFKDFCISIVARIGKF